MFNKLMQSLISKRDKIAVVGLGYVGLPAAIAFCEEFSVIGYDKDSEKIQELLSGNDPTKEGRDDTVGRSGIRFTSDASDLKEAKVCIVTVPTPVTANNVPDLTILEEACSDVGSHLSSGSVVVFESTVYPGLTEEFCIPWIEKHSGMKCGDGFYIAYSPERINPGDKVHRFDSIVKIVSAQDDETLQFVAELYGKVVKAGVYKAPNIKVAEAAKVIENIQRDVNVALMNELSQIFNMAGIDTNEVIKAASTRWNFLHFRPGLVGGHCVAVDPYYLTYHAESLGFHSRMILTGRAINNEMTHFVAENIVKLLIRAGKTVQNSKVAVFGASYKENCPDARYSKVFDLISELGEYGIKIYLCDPVADAKHVENYHHMKLMPKIEDKSVDAVVIAVAHDCFRNLDPDGMGRLYADDSRIIVDLMSCLNREEYESSGYLYWAL